MLHELSIHQRQSHLSNMGVAQWYSRTALLGAKSSPKKLFDEAVKESLIESSEPQSAPKDLLNSLKGRDSAALEVEVNPAPSHSKSTIDIALPSGSTANEADVSPQDEERVYSTEQLLDGTSLAEDGKLSPVQAFSVNCYLSSDVLVITECSNQSGVSRESQLLVNIFKSLESLKSTSSGLDYYQSFHWPVFHSLNLQSSQSAELNEAISVWLKSCINQQKKIFYFGGSQFALKELVEQCLSEMRFYSFKYSLQDMLQIPMRKKDVWVQLQEYSF